MRTNNSNILKITLIFIFFNSEMDSSGGSVPTGQNLTSGMEPGMNKYENLIFSVFKKNRHFNPFRLKGPFRR